ncbi:fungal-specific transcription factor domain-containing protein [Trichoderma austrokoningii]
MRKMPRARKQATRSFSACWTCRRRRVKCNGTGLPCNQCKKCRLECEGYSIQLVWVDQKTGTYPPMFRRSMNFEQTWHGWPAFSEDHLQRLIDEMDSINIPISKHSQPLSPFTVFHSTQPTSPSVLASSDNPTANKSELNLQDNASLTDLSQSERPPTPYIEAYSLYRSLTPTIYDWLSTSRDEATIFHHYVTWIAPIMIPVDNTNNPWKSVYPSTALQDSSAASRALYHAIIAQSAFNLANLYKGCRQIDIQKQSIALEHYGASLRELSQTLNYTKEAEYNACAATLYTLMIAEGQARDSVAWRSHFNGAGSFVTQFVQQKPWVQSTRAWVISQSIALSFEISQTGNAKPHNRSPITEILFEGVASRRNFGYTIGASCDVLRIISSTRLFMEQIAHGDVPENLCLIIQGYMTELLPENHTECRIDLDIPERENIVKFLPRTEQFRFLDCLHLRLFRTAALIYIHQAILKVPPRGVSRYVRSVLLDAMTFINIRGGAISMWPVFIAATEATHEADQQMVERWLEVSSQLGIPNRLVAGTVIRQIWHDRAQEAIVRGVEPDQVVLDWKTVQQRLGVDLLLL